MCRVYISYQNDGLGLSGLTSVRQFFNVSNDMWNNPNQIHGIMSTILLAMLVTVRIAPDVHGLKFSQPQIAVAGDLVGRRVDGKGIEPSDQSESSPQRQEDAAGR